MQYIKSRQMAKADRLAVEEYGIRILQLMENAGHRIARFVAEKKPKDIYILCGKGNNGGDGLCAARHLIMFGFEPKIVLAEKDLNEYSVAQYKTLARMGFTATEDLSASDGDFIIDCLLGYNIKGNPRGSYAVLINKANECQKNGAEIISIDVPSGIDPDTGSSFTPAISPDSILTLSLPKEGLSRYKNVYVANIGLPEEIFNEMGIVVPRLFKDKDIVQIDS